jgi:hypothetical protein
MNDKPKIALCLHGIAAGKNFKHGGLEVSFKEEAKSYKKHIVDINDCDVFMHSWSVDARIELDAIYSPKASLFENSEVLYLPTIFERIKDFKKKVRGKKRELYRLNNIYSRWLTFKRAVDLVRDYEKIHGISYDFIMVSRFDTTLKVDVDFSKLDSTKFYAGDWIGYRDSAGDEIPEENLANHPDKYFKYSRGFPANNDGLQDFWFISNSNNMMEFSKIYDELDYLIQKTGVSNHRISARKLKEMGLLKNFERLLVFSEDYCLTRWM